MKAVQIINSGQDAHLDVGEADTPEIKDGHILIKVAAAGLNRADILQRKGMYPPPPGASEILGLEVSGTVAQTKSDLWSEGDQVCALLSGGGYAEYASVDARHCFKVPDHMDLIDAAALPEAIYTVWNNIFDIGKFRSGQTALVHGGSSGIGTMAIQMIKATGGHIIVTAGSDEKCQFCMDLGADTAINYKSSDFVDIIKASETFNAVDLVLDMVGGDYIQRNLQVLKPNGTHVNIATQQGRKSEIDIGYVMRKRLKLTGSTLRGQADDEKARLAGDIFKTIWPFVENATIKPIIDTYFTINDANDAHAYMESSNHKGKILLTL